LPPIIEAPGWRRNLWAIVAAEALTFLAFQSSAVLIPYYVQQMGLTDLNQLATWTGTYQSVGPVAMALATPIWGIIGDRYGRKPMLVRATVALAIVLGGMAFARTPGQLMALRVLQGCMTGTATAATALLATSTPKLHLAYALGLLQTALYAGSSLGPMVGGFVGDTWSYRAAFGVASGLVVVSLLLILLLVRGGEVIRRAASDRPAGRSVRRPLGERLREARPAAVLVMVTMAISMTYGLTAPVLPLYVQQLAPQSDRLASLTGTIIGAGALTAAVAALVIGKVSGRLGHHRMLTLCAAGTGLCYLPQALATSPLLLGVFTAIQGFFRGAIGPNVTVGLVERTAPEKVGATLGINSSASSVGAAVGPMLGAWLMNTASAPAAFWAAGAAFVLITLVLLSQRRGAVARPARPERSAIGKRAGR
jgi:DHA1 family multidrug resistance protein-like MFS transporter